MNQKTLKKPCSFEGIGIHSGRTISLRLCPSESSGIRFVRTDRHHAEIPVHPDSLGLANRATALTQNGIYIKTPEHLLSACYALGITNLKIEISDEEVPILDGSALPFVQEIRHAGVQVLSGVTLPIVLDSILIEQENNSWIVAVPDPQFRVTFILDYPESFVGNQTRTFTLTESGFLVEIAAARTFGFYSEMKSLLDRGLALGGSLENAVVIGDQDYLNPLRFPDELVRHKILDCIGDLAVLGRSLQAHLVCTRSGHDLNRKMVQKIWKTFKAGETDRPIGVR